MRRIFLALISAVAFISCFDETGYDTLYVLRVYEQEESGDDFIPLDGCEAYAFAGNTDEWEISSYEDARAGVLTSIETGEQRGPFAWSEPYNDSETQLQLQLDREEVILVIVDPATEVYAYTDYTVPVNFSEVVVDIVFRPWKDSSFTASTWTFIMPTVESDDEDDVE